MKPRVAINKNDAVFKHSEMWTDGWIQYCEKNEIPFELVDGYRYNIIEKLREFDILVWHPQNFVLSDMLEARSILSSAQKLGLKVFPDYNTSWHFDDKIAETYLLQSVNAPLPKSWMFYLLPECITWLNEEAVFPLVAKLKSGSGSNNVRLLKCKKQAIRYAKRMFLRGFKPSPSMIFKAKSKLQSSPDWKTAKSRLRRIPEFLRTLSRARMLPKEKGYVFFQEFIPNDGYDLKIVVIGNKVSGFARKTRKGDFRASGGGDLIYNNGLINKDIRDIAFRLCDKLKFQCMGFDFVVDNNTGKEYIVEMSFGFSQGALLNVDGYWDRDGILYAEPMNAPEEILKNILGTVSK
jgi:glutathione synthase/RimK-type ligase-like ATP-grasp enzyme